MSFILESTQIKTVHTHKVSFSNLFSDNFLTMAEFCRRCNLHLSCCIVLMLPFGFGKLELSQAWI